MEHEIKQKKSRRDLFYLNKGLILSIIFTGLFIAITLPFRLIPTNHLININGVLNGIAGTLIGFNITGIALFYAIPFSDRMRKNIERFRYDIITPRAFFFAIITFIISIFIFFFGSHLIAIKINFYLIILGIFQTFFCARLLYILGTKSRK